MTLPPLRHIGPIGIAAGVLACIAAGLLGAATTGLLTDAATPLIAAACGLAAALLGLLRPASPAANPPQRAEISDTLSAVVRALAEEMLRLKRDGAEASRALAQARQSGQQLTEMAAATNARLTESAELSGLAAQALSALPGLADRQAQRIEALTARAERALATPMAGPSLPPGLTERLDAVPQVVETHLRAWQAEAAAQLENTLARLEAARPDPALAIGVIEATERLEGLAAQAASENAAVAATLSGLVESLAPMPEAMAARIVATLDASLAAAAPPEAVMARLENLSSALGEAGARLDDSLRSATVQAPLLDRIDAAALRVEDAAASLEVTLPQALAARVEATAAEALRDLPAGLAPLLEAEFAPVLEAKFTHLLEAHLAEVLRAQLGPVLAAELAPVLATQLDQVAREMTAATALLPEANVALRAHLDALALAGPTLDRALDRTLDRLDRSEASLARLSGTIVPASETLCRLADTLPRAAEAMQATATRLAEASPAAEPPASIATSILGRMAAEEEPAIAATLLRLDGIGQEVTALMRGTEHLVDAQPSARISRNLAVRAPELLGNLDATIRGLQSVATAIAVAADRGLTDRTLAAVR